MKAIFSKISAPESVRRNKALGASTGNFDPVSLDAKTVIIIKLTCYVFGSLDRQSISAMENRLGLRSDHRKQVSRQVAAYVNRPQGLSAIYKEMRTHRLSDHSSAYSIFERVCMIASYSARFDKSILRNLVGAGKQFGLTQDEIYRVIAKTKLAV